MQNVTFGCLAIVINAKRPENIGKIVTVGRFYQAGDKVEIMGMVKNVPRAGWLCESPSGFVFADYVLPRAMIPDSHLRPVSGLPDDQDVLEQYSLKETI